MHCREIRQRPRNTSLSRPLHISKVIQLQTYGMEAVNYRMGRDFGDRVIGIAMGRVAK